MVDYPRLEELNQRAKERVRELAVLLQDPEFRRKFFA